MIRGRWCDSFNSVCDENRLKKKTSFFCHFVATSIPTLDLTPNSTPIYSHFDIKIEEVEDDERYLTNQLCTNQPWYYYDNTDGIGNLVLTKC